MEDLGNYGEAQEGNKFLGSPSCHFVKIWYVPDLYQDQRGLGDSSSSSVGKLDLYSGLSSREYFFNDSLCSSPGLYNRNPSQVAFVMVSAPGVPL